MKKAKKTKIRSEKKGLFKQKKEKIICCPYCKSTEYEILKRNVFIYILPPLNTNHTQGVCRKCGKSFKIN